MKTVSTTIKNTTLKNSIQYCCSEYRVLGHFDVIFIAMLITVMLSWVSCFHCNAERCWTKFSSAKCCYIKCHCANQMHQLLFSIKNFFKSFKQIYIGQQYFVNFYFIYMNKFGTTTFSITTISNITGLFSTLIIYDVKI